MRFIRKTILISLSMLLLVACLGSDVNIGKAPSQSSDPLPSWNQGAAKESILTFIRQTTDQSSPQYVPLEQRIATFDQDGTLWVEHPMYTQVIYCLERVPTIVKAKPELATVEPFKTVLSGNLEAIAELPLPDLEKILVATLSGMAVDEFSTEVKNWIATGDRQMLEYTKAGEGARLAMLLQHDDTEREYTYGPAQRLPNTKVGTFPQTLYDQANKQGWTVISMKNDWKQIFSFEK